MYNVEVRDAIKQARLFNYEIATAVGMHETSFSRKLARSEFSPSEKERILDVIKEIRGAERK